MKRISFRKYLNYLLFLVTVVIIALLGSKIYNIIKENNIKTSVMNRVVGTIQIDDIENATKEFTSNNFILISYANSKDTHKLENRLKKIVIDNNLQDNFYYLDATEMMTEKNYLDIINKKFKIEENKKIEALPVLLYYKDGVLTEIISSKTNKIMSSDELAQLIDEYEINKTIKN